MIQNIYLFDIMQFMLMKSGATIAGALISHETHEEEIKCKEP